MAKKKTEPETPAETPTEAPEEKKKTKTAMIQEAMSEGVSSAKDIVGWVKAKYNTDVSENSVNTTKSNLRKASGEGSSRKAKVEDGEPTIADLIKVKKVLGDAPDIQEALKVVTAAATQVGGLVRLQKCLDALEELK